MPNSMTVLLQNLPPDSNVHHNSIKFLIKAASTKRQSQLNLYRFCYLQRVSALVKSLHQAIKNT